MVKKSLLLLCSSLICLFGLLCSFGVGTTYAYNDSSLPYVESVYSSKNLGYSTFGFSNSSPNNFGNLTIRPNYDNTFLSFMCRAGLVVSSAYGVNNITGYDFSPVLQIRNEYYCLRMTNGYLLGGSSSNLNGGYNYATNNSLSLRLSHTNLNGILLGSMLIPVQLYNYNSIDRNINSLCYFAMRFDNSDDVTNYVVLSDLASFDIVSVEIGSSNNWSYGDAFGSSLVGSSYRFNYVIYRSALGSSYLFAFGCSTNVNTTYLWDNRNYYLNSDVNVNLPSYQSGYNAGYDNGYSVGTSEGYNAGVEAASNYTFFSLISAVIDAPITAFKSLFNFDFLGFNMLNFVTGLITFCFLIWIIRLIL